MEGYTIPVIIGLAGTLCSIMFAYIGYLKGAKKDSHTKGAESGKLLTDVAYTKSLVEDIRLSQKETNETLSRMAERITRNEESIKSAHARIEKLEQKGGYREN